MQAFDLSLVLCLLNTTPLMPFDPTTSGWHTLSSPPGYARPDFDHWYWDARLGVWRRWEWAFEAESPQSMACEDYFYTAPAASPVPESER